MRVGTVHVLASQVVDQQPHFLCYMTGKFYLLFPLGTQADYISQSTLVQVGGVTWLWESLRKATSRMAPTSPLQHPPCPLTIPG